MNAPTSAASQPDQGDEPVELVRTGPHALPPRPRESPQDAASRAAATARRLPSAVPVRQLPPRPPLPSADEPPASREDVAGTVETVAPGPDSQSVEDEAVPTAGDEAILGDEGDVPGEDVPSDIENEPDDEPVAVVVEEDSPVIVAEEDAPGTIAEEDLGASAADADETELVAEGIERESVDDDAAVTVDATTSAPPRTAEETHDPEAEAVEALAHVFDDSLDEAPVEGTPALRLRGVSKAYGRSRAVDAIDLTVPAGTFYGIVGPNGAGKTTTLSMVTGLLRPDAGEIEVAGVDARTNPRAAKRLMGVLPDRLRTFDRLTGRQLLYYYGTLRGLAPSVVESRTADLARAFDLTAALSRVVSDYSAGMTKKVMLAGAMIHAPRVLVLDEPFEAVDPVSSAVILDILRTFVAHGGTVVLSSHGMDLVENVCSRVAVIVAGQVLAEGTVERVRGELTLEQRFIELAGGLSDVEGLEWLHTYSG